MKDTLTNQLTMIGACIATAESPEHNSAWFGLPPEDFGPDLAQLKADYEAASGVATLAGSAITGAAQAKDVAETTLENRAHQLARALASHYRKTGNLTDLAKVDIRIGQLQKLRDQALVARTTEIHTLASQATGQEGAAGRGITVARVNDLENALNAYKALVHTPRSTIADRTMHLRDLTTRVAGLMEDIRALDDLVLQMDDTEPRRNFIGAWKRARIIVDAGHGPGEEPPPTPPTP